MLLAGVLAASTGSNSAGAAVLGGTGAGSRKMGGALFLIAVFFCYAVVLTPLPSPSFPPPCSCQELQAGAVAAGAVDR